MLAHTSPMVRRIQWVAGGLLVACGLTVTACGSASAPRSGSSPTAPTPTINTPTTPGNLTTGGATKAAPAPNANLTNANGPTTHRSGGPAASQKVSPFAKIAGNYVGGTADQGRLYIRSDGASRYRAPDRVACPTCITATAPIASLDFTLTTLSSRGPGSYTASGSITATSDPAWASHLSPKAKVGAPISLSIAPGGYLSLSVLPGFDVLTFAYPVPSSFSEIAGDYAGGTADAGSLYIRSDGASRFRAPDTVACPTCTTATAPIASLDFRLTGLTSRGSILPTGVEYAASGSITATSDAAWASRLSPVAKVGDPIYLNITPGGRLYLSILPDNDVLALP